MQRRTVLGVLAVLLSIGVLLTLNDKLQIVSPSSGNSNNFNWNDNWNNKQSNNLPKPEMQPEVKPEALPAQAIKADSYDEALKISGEKGMPVLVIFSGDHCQYCRKFKSEVLPSAKVQNALKGYVYVIVDTGSRAGQRVASKYGLKYIPAFAITNHKEDKLKFDEKYMSSDQFSRWLNNPHLMEQPKISPREPERRLEPERREERPQPR